METQKEIELFEELLLANPDFDGSLLLKDEDGIYEDSSIDDQLGFFQAGIEIAEREARMNAKPSVPEGFVLVPKNKSEAFSKKLNDYLDDAWKDGNGFDDGFVSVNEISHDKIWSLVIEAQEPSNV